MEWGKFLSTEWIAFILLSSFGVAAFFVQPVEVPFLVVGGFLASLAVNLGVVRSWQKATTVKLGK